MLGAVRVQSHDAMLTVNLARGHAMTMIFVNLLRGGPQDQARLWPDRPGSEGCASWARVPLHSPGPEPGPCRGVGILRFAQGGLMERGQGCERQVCYDYRHHCRGAGWPEHRPDGPCFLPSCMCPLIGRI